MTAPDFSLLEEILLKNEEKFRIFYGLLEENNKKFNLTSIRGDREVKIKHFLDSLAGIGLFEENASVCEVGSGAGFPSIPLMIAREDLRFTLIESTGKKCVFLREAAEKLSLPAEVLNLRAEDAGRGALREKFDCVCARAVAPLPTLIEYCLPLVKVGGRMVAYKGAETENGQLASDMVGGGAIERIEYELPEEMGKRSLVVIKKVKKTPPRYPRGNGQERKKPLC